MGLEEFAASIESEILRHVFDRWQAARTDERAPLWSAIEAEADPVVRDYAWGWRLDPASDELLGFMMGPKPREMYGADAVGRTQAQFYPEMRRAIVEGHMREVIRTPMLHRAHGTIYWRERRTDKGERILLPLRFAAEREPDALLGTAVYEGMVSGATVPQPPIQKILRVRLYD